MNHRSLLALFALAVATSCHEAPVETENLDSVAQPSCARCRAAAERERALTRDERKTLEASDAPSEGPLAAPVQLVVFVDYECPFSSKLSRTLGDLRRDFGDELRIVYRHMPLPFHAAARPAARAAVAAAQQGRFLELQSKFFTRQGLDASTIPALAAEAGLDPAALTRAMEDPKTDARVQSDIDLAGRVGVRGTPVMFINGTRVSGAQPFEEVRRVVEAALGDSVPH
jgi:protein-disulfide isomerase